MHAIVGDRIIVRSSHSDEPNRDGEIVEVRGSDGAPPYLVRWSETGHDGLFFPGPDSDIHHTTSIDDDAAPVALPGAGTAPWPPRPEQPGSSASRMAWYAAVARWAPSKHNTQPWRFHITADAVEFWGDPTRMLAETDPVQRELVISVGAAVHHACVAARALGHAPQLELTADAATGCLARLVERGPHPVTKLDSDLLAAAAGRRTDRGPLDATTLAPSLPFELQSLAGSEGTTLRLVSTPGDRATLAALVERADRLLAQRSDVSAELNRWLREANDPRRDGVPSDHTRGAAASYRAEFVQRDFSSPDSRPAHDRSGTDRPLLGVICTDADRPRDWLLAGQALAAVLLRAHLAGANASYLNQPVEVPALRAELRDGLALNGFAQLVIRLGRGAEIAPTPRRTAADTTAYP